MAAGTERNGWRNTFQSDPLQPASGRGHSDPDGLRAIAHFFVSTDQHRFSGGPLVYSQFMNAKQITSCFVSSLASLIFLNGLATNEAAAKKLIVGFSQIGAESAWRSAETESIRTEAQKRGVDLK